MQPRASGNVNPDAPPLRQCLGEPCGWAVGHSVWRPGDYSVHPLEAGGKKLGLAPR